MTTSQITLSQILGTESGTDGVILFANIANANAGGSCNSNTLFVYNAGITTLSIGGPANSTTVGLGSGRSMIWLAGTGTNKDALIGFANDNNFMCAYLYGTNTQFNILTEPSVDLMLTAGGTNRMRFATNGEIMIGGAAAGQYVPTYFGGQPGIFYADAGNKSFVTMGRWEVTPFGASFGFFKSNNATIGTMSTAVNGDSSGDIVWFNTDGANWIAPSRIIQLIDGLGIGTNSLPGSLQIMCTANGNPGGNTNTERVRFRGVDYTTYFGPGPAYSSQSQFAGSTRATVQLNGPSGGDALLEFASAGTTLGYVYGYSSGCRIYAPASKNLEFAAGGSVFNYLTSAGQSLFNGSGSTVGGSSHQVSVFAAGASTMYGVGISLAGTGSSSHLMTFANTNGGVVIGSITCATSTTTAFNTSSDYRLKSNVEHLAGGISTIMSVQPRAFDWYNGEKGIGFIAHELQAVVPEAVTHQKDEVDANGNMVIQQVDFSKLVPYLVAAVKEQQAMINTLQQEVAALKAKLP